jgi:hypothetical protein
MGWVRQTIGAQGTVNGLIVAKEVSDKLRRYAISVIPNAKPFEYQVEFRLTEASDLV